MTTKPAPPICFCAISSSVGACLGKSGVHSRQSASSASSHHIVRRSAAVNAPWAATVKNTVPSTATPVAPAICCRAFITPEAEPVSRSETEPTIVLNSGAISRPIPRPMSSSGTTRSQLVVCEPSMAGITSA